MNVSDILSKAADLIEERGLNKGWYFGPDGSCCMRGAIILATDPTYPLLSEAEAAQASAVPFIPFDASKAFRKLDAHLLRRHICFDAVSWQDAEERTEEEVVGELRAAAEAARAG